MNEWTEDEYPEELINSLDEYFPKGDKRRGHALVIQAIAFIQGEKVERARIEKIIDKSKLLEVEKRNLKKEISK